MTDTDITAVSTIRVAGWQAAYAGTVPQTYLENMTVEADAQALRARFARSGPQGADLVAVDDRTGVVGWASFGPCRGAEADTGELYALYVHPRLIGTGVGRRLLTAVHADAVTCDFRTLLLWVLRDNPRARRFYELAGYAPDGAVQYDDYDGVPVPEVRYRRRMGT